MLAAHVEVFPGGAANRRRTVSGIAAANISSLAEDSDYYAIVVEDGEVTGAAHVTGHRRDAGAIELLRRILNEVTEDLSVVPEDYLRAMHERMQATHPRGAAAAA